MSAHDDPAAAHRGVVQRVHDGRAIVAMETAGCGSCGHGAHCGIGRLAAGRAATLLALPAPASVRPGDAVAVLLPAGRVHQAAWLGYFFPALALLGGAGLGVAFGGSDAAAALGAAAGLFGALAATRALARLRPAWMPVPRLVPLSRPVSTPSQEPCHER